MISQILLWAVVALGSTAVLTLVVGTAIHEIGKDAGRSKRSST